MLNTRASERYAKSLLSLSIDKNIVDEINSDIDLIIKSFEDSREVANLYSKNLPENIISPTVSKEIKSAWAQYTITIHERDIIQTKLKENGIPSIIYYPIPLSRQAGYEKYPEVSSGLHVSNLLSESVLSLPMHPYLKKDEIVNICSKLSDLTLK